MTPASSPAASPAADSAREQGPAQPAGHNPVVRLPSGDSVEYVAAGPAQVPNQAPGLLVTYHPFFSPDADTARVKRVALEFWRASVQESLTPPLPPFVVLQATSRRAGPIRGAFTEATFGVVLERRDGKWYRYGTSEPVG